MSSRPCVVQLQDGSPFYPLEHLRAPVHWPSVTSSLSRIPRFTGHTRRDLPAYSVAQHCVLVSQLVRGDLTAQRAGLLHDVAEALGFNDLAGPLRDLPEMLWYRRAERECLLSVCALPEVGIPREGEHWDLVREADETVLWIEKRDVLSQADWWGPGSLVALPDWEIVALSQEEAEGAWWDRAEELGLELCRPRSL